MWRRNLVIIVILALGPITGYLPADAQEPGKVSSIGLLGFSSPTPDVMKLYEPFFQALQEQGYVVGENVVAQWRWAQGKRGRLAELADELARLPVDIIVAPGTQQALAAQQATRTIPIVMVYVADPIRSGLVVSLARPGGNVTGVAWLFDDLGAKQLELLQEIVPGMSRVAVLWHAGDPGQNMPRVRAVEVLAAFELVDDRQADYAQLAAHVFSAIADNAWNAGIVLGVPIIDWHTLDLAAARGMMRINDTVVGEGHGRDVMGHPLEALTWLVNMFAKRGKSLSQGMVIMTGSVITTKFVRSGDRVSLSVDGLGEVSLRVE